MTHVQLSGLHCTYFCQLLIKINNYSATLNNMKLVHF